MAEILADAELMASLNRARSEVSDNKYQVVDSLRRRGN